MRIILVDDHSLFRAGLKSYLEAQPDTRIVAEASNVEEARTAVATCACAVVLLDLNLDQDGVGLIREFCDRQPDLRILVVSMDSVGARARQAMLAGARGYLVKSAESHELMAALTLVASGGVYVHPAVARFVMTPTHGARTDGELNERERRVLELLVRGASNEEMANLMHISVSTVKGHLRSLFARFGVSDRTHLVAEAVSRGVVQTRPSADRVK